MDDHEKESDRFREIPSTLACVKCHNLVGFLHTDHCVLARTYAGERDECPDCATRNGFGHFVGCQLANEAMRADELRKEAGVKAKPNNLSVGAVGTARENDVANGRAIEQIVAALTSLGEPQSGLEIKRLYAEAQRIVDNRTNWLRGVGQQDQKIADEPYPHAPSEQAEVVRTAALDAIHDRLAKFERSLVEFRNDMKSMGTMDGLSIDCDLRAHIQYKIVNLEELSLLILEDFGKEGWKPGPQKDGKTLFYRETHIRHHNYVNQRDVANPKATF